MNTEFTVYSTASDLENNNIFTAAAVRLGEGHYGFAAGWIRSEFDADTVRAAISAARTIKGDPIGFMEGVFGPSISIGASLEYSTTEDFEQSMQHMLSASAGFQFSVFPTVAVGANVSGLRLVGDKLGSRSIGYGFTSIFDKRFRGHFSVTDGNTAVGFELNVNDWLTVRTGSDGSSWNSGISFDHDWLGIEWAVILDDMDCRQVLGITVTPGGGS